MGRLGPKEREAAKQEAQAARAAQAAQAANTVHSTNQMDMNMADSGVLAVGGAEVGQLEELVFASLSADTAKASHMYLAASVLSTERDLRIDHQMAKEEAFNSLGDEACYMKDMRRRWEADLAAKDKEIEALRKKDKSMEAELYNLRAEFDAFKQQMETFQLNVAMKLSLNF
ncbi:hypothetical protein NKR19_g2422 [Coniochaeta hoffmannii]|uniref:Uncharacterized protein n=1 Tax=Coniochaeta hoffmannii TaxID=91930 RepID=A0AA38VN31_9PEZI|nr:hypothetical protein NKR19_g2422 [Coniochaeta hoffmannii]